MGGWLDRDMCDWNDRLWVLKLGCGNLHGWTGWAGCWVRLVSSRRWRGWILDFSDVFGCDAGICEGWRCLNWDSWDLVLVVRRQSWVAVVTDRGLAHFDAVPMEKTLRNNMSG